MKTPKTAAVTPQPERARQPRTILYCSHPGLLLEPLGVGVGGEYSKVSHVSLGCNCRQCRVAPWWEVCTAGPGPSTVSLRVSPRIALGTADSRRDVAPIRFPHMMPDRHDAWCLAAFTTAPQPAFSLHSISLHLMFCTSDSTLFRINNHLELKFEPNYKP